LKVGTAAYNNVLTVVYQGPGFGVGKGKCPPAQELPGFYQGYGVILLQKVHSGGDSRDAAAQDNYVRF
jgi:hypothetical protein